MAGAGSSGAASSIFARIMLLVLGTLLVAQLIGLLLLVTLPPLPQPMMALDDIAAEIAGGEAQALTRWPASAPPVAGAGQREVADELAQLLAARLGREARDVRIQPAPGQHGRLVQVFAGPQGARRARPALVGQFRVGIREADGRWTIHAPAQRVALVAPERQFVAMFLATALLLLPVVWWFARYLSEPLFRFADAAERIGRNPAEAPPAIEGPAEIVRAARAVSGMQERLNAFIADRTGMLAAIAHDLRTPLTRLAFRAEAVEGPLGEAIRADLAEMRAMVQDSLQATRDLQPTGPRQRLELGAVVEQVAADMELVGRSVEARVEAPAIVEADPVAIRRIIANILDNAEKYGGAACATVTSTGSMAEVRVEDGGTAPAGVDLERLFDPFVRGEPSRSRETGGAGLGLSIARSLARAHGGDLRLEAGARGGLVAVLTLPLA